MLLVSTWKQKETWACPARMLAKEDIAQGSDEENDLIIILPQVTHVQPIERISLCVGHTIKIKRYRNQL